LHLHDLANGLLGLSGIFFILHLYLQGSCQVLQPWGKTDELLDKSRGTQTLLAGSSQGDETFSSPEPC